MYFLFIWSAFSLSSSLPTMSMLSDYYWFRKRQQMYERKHRNGNSSVYYHLLTMSSDNNNNNNIFFQFNPHIYQLTNFSFDRSTRTLILQTHTHTHTQSMSHVYLFLQRKLMTNDQPFILFHFTPLSHSPTLPLSFTLNCIAYFFLC